MNLVQKYVTNLPNFTSPIKSSNFSKVPYRCIIHNSTASGSQNIVISEVKPLPNSQYVYFATTPHGQALNGITATFTAYNIPMKILSHTAAGALDTITAYRLNAATAEQYMVTAALTGCAFTIYKDNQDLYVCHIQPNQSYSVVSAGTPTPINAINLPTLILRGDLPIHYETGAPADPTQIVGIYGRIIPNNFTKPAIAPGTTYMHGGYANIGTVIAYQKKGKWSFLAQTYTLYPTSNSAFVLPNNAYAVLYQQP